MTPLRQIYDAFFTLITDDMYMEITEEETRADCRALLGFSLPLFEFPNQVINIVDATEENVIPAEDPEEEDTVEILDISYIDSVLTQEEINILAIGMQQIWLQRQLTSVELIRQKFSGPDFRLTSQAAHMSRLMHLIEQVKTEHRRLQMLYSRREIVNGKYISTFGKLVH